MLSLAQCRELLGPEHAIDDEELRRIRDAFYQLAPMVCDDMKPTSLMLAKAKRLAPDGDWEHVCERAAIYEHEACFPRDEAERRAICEVLRLPEEDEA